MTRPTRRRPLSQARVLAAALALADADGIEAVSMRRLGQVLGVEAMSLYKHVAGKDEILDGLAELVMAEVEVPPQGHSWRAAVSLAAGSMHQALIRHSWAAAVIESRRRPGPNRLRYLDAMVGVLREAGFSIEDVARAFLAIDSMIYGHALQLANVPFDTGSGEAVAEEMVRDHFAGRYPNLVAMGELAMAGPVPVDLEFGLDLVLDGLERHLAATR